MLPSVAPVTVQWLIWSPHPGGKPVPSPPSVTNQFIGSVTEMALWLSNSPAWEESNRLCQGHGSPHPAPTLL